MNYFASEPNECREHLQGVRNVTDGTSEARLSFCCVNLKEASDFCVNWNGGIGSGVQWLQPPCELPMRV